ncbi:MAG: hypothetical protein KTR26_20310 [Flammeovirgaceae bacterium]|nr:hypothetical protein [Flammeovirgaceae bacterium]
MPSKSVWEKVSNTENIFASLWWEKNVDHHIPFSESLFEGEIFSSLFHRLEKGTKT